MRRVQRSRARSGSIILLSTTNFMPEPPASQTKQPAAIQVCYTEA